MAVERRKKLLVVQAAALGFDVAQQHGAARFPLPAARLDPVFPALTCAVQAAMRTGLDCSRNGMPGNGYLDRTLMRPLFWEQSAAQVEGPRIWNAFRAGGGTVGMLFWQQSLGESVDLLLSPAPVHRHHGGMIQDCYSKPDGLYRDLCMRVGNRFDLRHYWGPMASVKSSAWVAAATAQVMQMRIAPDLLFTYLPGLDYDLQRFGPSHPRCRKAYQAVCQQITDLLETAARTGYETVVFGDYAIREVHRAVYPNRILRDAGLMQCRTVAGRLYPDLYRSEAFAVVDHEIAHLYVKDPAAVASVAARFGAAQGVAAALSGEAKAAAGVDHPRSGDIVLTAAEGCWFAYPWWHRGEREPEYAGHVDIHSKPGFDPCELLFGWPPMSVSRDTARIGGSHGLVSGNACACWGSTFLAPEPLHQLDLARKIREYLRP